MPEPESITSIELQIPCGERPPLGTTLTVPAKPRAAALILQGSGPHDRDGAMPAFNFRSTLYKRLALELSQRFGIACLRYDKRGHDLPAEAPRNYSFTERERDASWALGVMKMRQEVADLPWLVVGHSEGGIIASGCGVAWTRSTNARGQRRLAGVISLAAPFGDVFKLNRERARLASHSNVATTRAKGESALEFYDKLERIFRAGEQMSPTDFRTFAEPYLDRGFAGWESFEWLREHWSPKAALSGNEGRDHQLATLVVQGGRDARLPEDNPKMWEEWCAARKLATYLFIPDMGHDLNDARRKAFVLDESLLAGIGNWVKQILKD